MGITDRFDKVVLKLLDKYGSTGTLQVPNGLSTFDPVTGDTTQNYDESNIKYVPYPLTTNPDSDFGLTSFIDSAVTFNIRDISVVVNETCFIVGIDGVKWDITLLKTLKCCNTIVAYEAKVKAHR